MRKLQQSVGVVILLAAPAHLEARMRNPSSKMIPLQTRISPLAKYDWKVVCSQMNLVINKDENNKSVELAGLQVIMVQKSEPRAIYSKTSYEETEFQKALVIKRKKIDVKVKTAYTNKPGLADRKKKTL
ncbi:hypothetical protein HHI36_010491 [Cryptolaemus montrouzieri]|uniref:Uncharacterized protein n=1 Tax=Cryptolaemus montrouzieri TaxID=559131 RepID=A0ABD2MJ02_9CUCU